MNKDPLTTYFEDMAPNEAQKARMKSTILASGSPESPPARPSRRRRAWLAVPAACLVLALALFLAPTLGGDTSAYAISVKVGEDGAIFRLEEHERGSDGSSNSISKVDSRPGLEFYIDGDNIAKIEITSENEYLYAVDWTKTQHEKFWNVEYYQTFDEERQMSIADFSLLFDKKITMTFDDDFSEYDRIWYRWTAWKMHQWASENNYSRFLGAGLVPESTDSQEATKLAAGNDGSGNGHMQLEDYPEELTKDKITITITDREGKRTTKVINVKVSNNELRQTVVTASLAD